MEIRPSRCPAAAPTPAGFGQRSSAHKPIQRCSTAEKMPPQWMSSSAISYRQALKSGRSILHRELMCHRANRTSLVVIDKTGAFEKVEGNAQADLTRSQEADGDVGRRHDADLQIARLRPAAEDVGAVNRRQMRIAFEADANSQHGSIGARSDDFGDDADHGHLAGVLIDRTNFDEHRGAPGHPKKA